MDAQPARRARATISSARRSTIAGVASFGTSTTSPTARDLDVVEIADTLHRRSGVASVEGRADVLHNRVDDRVSRARCRARTRFRRSPNFERGVYVNFQQAFGEPRLSQSNPNVGVFVQDEWRPLRRADGERGAALRPAVAARTRCGWTPTTCRREWAWPGRRGDGRTVVRASGGVYYDRIPLRAISNALQRDGVQVPAWPSCRSGRQRPVVPARAAAVSRGTADGDHHDRPGDQNGRSRTARRAGRATARPPTCLAAAGYVHLRGRQDHHVAQHQRADAHGGEAAPLGVPNLGRPDPHYGNISNSESIGDSWFNGLTLSLG